MAEISDEDDIPTGLPDEKAEEPPLGPADADPDGTDAEPGPDAMPGIPTDGEPPTAG